MPTKKTTKKTTRKTTRKTGRPRKEIDWAKLDKLCFIQCTGEEIASVLEMDYDTLNRAIHREKKMSFADYRTQKGAGGKASLRRRQFQMAENNPTMAIWLGKQYLGQSDKNESVQHVFTEEIQLSSDESKLEQFIV